MTDYVAGRHPLTRLVSGYRDRVAAAKQSWQWYRALAARLGLSRPPDRTLLYRGPQPAGNRGSRPAGGPAHRGSRPAGGPAHRGPQPALRSQWHNITIPTWPEFVQYILTTPPSSDVRLIS